MTSQNTPRVSIIIPCYENAALLPRALESVRRQTVSDIEIIVIDDGSRIDPVTSAHLPDDPRVRLEALDRNRGYAGVTNYAIEIASAPWLLYVDADDAIQPWCVERLLATAERHAADLVLMPLACQRGGHAIGNLAFPATGDVLTPREAITAWARGELVLSQHCLLPRRPDVLAPEGYTYSDAVHTGRHVAGSGRIALLHEAGYLYEVHPGSTTGRLRPNVMELMQMPAQYRDICARVAQGRALLVLRSLVEDYTTTQVMHKAAGEPEDTALRREVRAWCRPRVGCADVARQLRRRQWAQGASWLLFWLSPDVHGRVYRWRGRRKGGPVVRGLRGVRALVAAVRGVVTKRES